MDSSNFCMTSAEAQTKHGLQTVTIVAEWKSVRLVAVMLHWQGYGNRN